MPYIPRAERERVIDDINDWSARGGGFLEVATPGELNFAISALINGYLENKPGPLNYAAINEVVGVLESAKLEFYRVVAAPYEDQKSNENGEVYTCRS